ncbi:MAG: PTS transporter subunit EIIA, partial [Bacteroidetes bacterium]|nr:PTS transporter subunit EIIA [Bacteroidota bacterium]
MSSEDRKTDEYTSGNSARVETDVMTLAEAAGYLKVAERTVLRMVHSGEIPCVKVGGQWRFLRTVIDDWLLSRMNFAPSSGPAAATGIRGAYGGSDTRAGVRPEAPPAGETPPHALPRDHTPALAGHRLSRFVHENRVQINIPRGLAKREVLSRLARPLSDGGVVTDHARFVSSLLERESMVSTAVAPGVALPHMRRPDAELVRGAGVSIGICAEGTEFDSLDGGPTRLFILLAAESESVHLTLLAQCGALIRDAQTVEHIVEADHASKVVRYLIETD